MTARNQEKPLPRAASAERRLVTVVFCDLVGSTRMSEMMDPDDLGWLAIKYEALCTASTAAFGGYVERFEGDGMVACFGYPYALENGAQRAVSAALDLVNAIREADWSALTSEPVRVRVGIDTGVVLSGDIVREDGLSQLNVLAGLTLNIACRMQELANPNSILISDATRQLVIDQFDTESLGARELKGLSKPVIVHRVLKAAPLVQQVNRVRRGMLLPLAGRQRELQALLEGWAKAQLGKGSVLGITGEPGIGKSRLVAELRRIVELEERATIIEMQCSPYHNNSSFFPLLQTFDREVAAEHSSGERLRNLQGLLARWCSDADDALRLLAPLLSLTVEHPPDAAPLSPEASKSRTTTLLADWILSHSAERALLVVVEDVQWMDPSSLAVMQDVCNRIAKGEYRAFVIMSFRSEFDVTACGIQRDGHTLVLTRLSDPEVERVVFNAGEGRIFPTEVLRQIVDNTEGVPLLAEELTKSIVRSGALIDRGSHYEPVAWKPVLTVPTTLHDLLRIRLDELGESRVVAQLAAVLGRTFAKTTLVQLFAGESEHLEHDLDRLIRDGVLEASEDGETLSFRHALIQKTAYDSLPKRSLREYHLRVARLLATGLDAMSSTQPELVARHFSLGDMPRHAVPLWLEAATRSIRRSANMEAIAHADQGIDAIRAANEPGVFTEAELFLNTTKGMALIATRGWSVPEVGETFARAAKLSEGLPATTDQTPALWGLWVYHLMRGDLQRAESYAEQILRIGNETGDTRILIEGNWTLGNTRFWQQRMDEAERYLQEAVRLYDPVVHQQNAFVYGQDPGVSALVYLTFVHSYLGHAATAIERGERALALAKQVGHPFSTAWARGANAMLRIELNDVPGTISFGEEALRYAMEQEQPFWIAAMQMAVGWARTRSGDATNGLRMAEEGIKTYRSMGVGIALGFFYTLLADCYLAAAKPETAGAWIDEGFKNAAGDLMYRPGLLMVRGGLKLMRGLAADAETDFRQALELCAATGARMRQFQAAAALAQVLAARGDSRGAAETLNPIIGWFREYGDTSIVQSAEQLLSSFSSPSRV
jgi:class 3 adenylate cyclase/tetratricopeptide (TPR) repeat protein